MWSVLKLTPYEPRYKKKVVHWPIRLTNSGLGSAFFVLSSLARFVWVCIKYIYMRYWGNFVPILLQFLWLLVRRKADSFHQNLINTPYLSLKKSVSPNLLASIVLFGVEFASIAFITSLWALKKCEAATLEIQRPCFEWFLLILGWNRRGRTCK